MNMIWIQTFTTKGILTATDKIQNVHKRNKYNSDSIEEQDCWYY